MEAKTLLDLYYHQCNHQQQKHQQQQNIRVMFSIQYCKQPSSSYGNLQLNPKQQENIYSRKRKKRKLLSLYYFHDIAFDLRLNPFLTLKDVLELLLNVDQVTFLPKRKVYTGEIYISPVMFYNDLQAIKREKKPIFNVIGFLPLKTAYSSMLLIKNYILL